MSIQGLIPWMNTNSGALNVALNFVMVLIWFIYLQIFLANFVRQRRPSILITRGGGQGLRARCLIGNMSSDPIYVLTLVARLRTRKGAVAVSITDVAHPVDEQELPVAQLTRQGPLDPGAYMEAGAFEDSLRRLDPEIDFEALLRERRPPVLEILVFAVHGSDELVVGARRDYKLERRDDRVVLVPVKLQTTQIRSRIRRWLLLQRWRRQLMT